LALLLILCLMMAGCGGQQLTERQKYMIAADSYVTTTTVLLAYLQEHPPTKAKAQEIAAWDNVAHNALNKWYSLIQIEPSKANPVAQVKVAAAKSTFDAALAPLLSERTASGNARIATQADTVSQTIIQLEAHKTAASVPAVIPPITIDIPMKNGAACPTTKEGGK
jgi:hypothetical protein